jgi:hypothetical protein
VQDKHVERRSVGPLLTGSKGMRAARGGSRCVTRRLDRDCSRSRLMANRPGPSATRTVSQRYVLGAHVRTRPVATLHPQCARAHLPCHSLAPSVLHVRTHRVTALHPRCTRAHPPCHGVTPPVRTCAPTVSQRYTVGAYVRTHRVTALHPRCARAHPPCHSVASSVHSCAPAMPHRRTRGARVRAHGVAAFHVVVSSHCPLTSRLHEPISFATTSKIVRFSALAAVGGTGVLDKHIRPVPARELS